MTKILTRFEPHFYLKSIIDIDPKLLKGYGIKCVFMDLDGVLTCLNDHHIDSILQDWILETQTLLPVKIMTFNHERKNLDLIESKFNLKILQRKMFEHPKSFYIKAAKSVECNAKQIMVINDSLIILELFAKPLGFITVKVPSIDEQIVHSPVGYIYRFGRWIEDNLIHPNLSNP
jgi:HAD superfamily phosphatase (TIGR01668 family)